MTTLIEASLTLVVSHYGHGSQVFFGEVIAGRPEDLSGVENVVGLFTHLLPVRINVDEEEMVERFLARLMEDARDRLDNAYVTADIIPTDSSHKPLDILLNIDNYPVDERFSRDDQILDISEIEYLADNAIPLTLVVFPNPKFSMYIQYDTHLYLKKDIDALIEDLCMIIKQLVVDSKATIESLISLLQENNENRASNVKRKLTFRKKKSHG